MRVQFQPRFPLFFASVLITITMLGTAPFARAASDEAEKFLSVWSGSLDYVRPDGRAQPVYFRLEIAEEDGKLGGSANAYQIGVSTDLSAVDVNKQKLSIEFPLAGEGAQLTASLDGDILRGIVKWSQGSRSIRLHRVFGAIDLDFVTSTAGLFEFDDGGELIIIPSGNGLNVYDNETMDFRRYFPESEKSFFAGATYLAPTPIETTLVFNAAADGKLVVSQQKSSGARTGMRSKRIVQEEISFQNGDVTLHGFLIRPRATSGKAPGVVVVWGSGRQNRFGYQGLPYHRAVSLASKGYASVVFDKRGVGASTGSYDDRTNELMAGDVVAAADYLASRPEVDAEKIGMVVHSQSGIYAPITIDNSEHIKFAAIIATTIANAEIQEIIRTEQQLRADGWPADDINEAVATQILKFYYADTRIGWDAYVAAYHRVVDKPWFDNVIGSTLDPERSSWDFWKKGNSYEPSDDWGDVQIPLFFLYGDHDAINPMEQNLSLLNEIFEGAPAGRFKLKLYENAEHSLFVAHEGGVLEESETSKLHPYLDDIIGWMDDVGFGASQGE